jgi:hypothetical protein
MLTTCIIVIGKDDDMTTRYMAFDACRQSVTTAPKGKSR